MSLRLATGSAAEPVTGGWALLWGAVNAAVDAVVRGVRRVGFDGVEYVRPANALRVLLQDLHGALLDLLAVQFHRCPLVTAACAADLPLSARALRSSAPLGRVHLGALGADAVEEDTRGFIGGVLGDQLAPESFGED